MKILSPKNAKLSILTVALFTSLASSGQSSSPARNAAQGPPSSTATAPKQGASTQSEMKGSRSKQVIQDRIAKEASDAEKSQKPIAEALSAIEETNSAIRFLNEKNSEKATQALQRAVGKLDIVLAQHPDLALIPLAAEVRVMDLVADEKTIKDYVKDVKDLVRRDELQLARQTMQNFASEIDVATTNIPMATYPVVIRDAASMIKENKLAEARAELMAALHSLVIAHRIIPLPVVKAQALIEEVNRQVVDKKINKDEADKMLNGAQEQLKIAELMGYGKKQNFSNLHSMISQLQRDINQKDNKGILSKIESDLKSLIR